MRFTPLSCAANRATIRNLEFAQVAILQSAINTSTISWLERAQALYTWTKSSFESEFIKRISAIKLFLQLKKGRW